MVGESTPPPRGIDKYTQKLSDYIPPDYISKNKTTDPMMIQRIPGHGLFSPMV